MDFSNSVLLDIYDGAQHCSASDFNEDALTKFKKVFQFDSAVIADLAVTPDHGFFVQSLHLHATPIERLRDRQKVIGPEKFNRDGSVSSRDIVLRSAYANRGTSVITDVSRTILDPDILNYARRYETAHSLTFISNHSSSGTITTITLGRAGKKNAFQMRHGCAADLLLPHILQARKINRRLALSFPADLHDSSTALANFNGCLHFVESKAIHMLQREWKQWNPPLLPRPLIDSLKQNKEKVFVGASIHVKASVQGNMICLVITPKANKEAGLTSAEYRTAKLAAEGLQYKEIARQLGISPATVRNQLHSVYKKLAVSNKTALTAVLSSQTADIEHSFYGYPVS